jgi:hypothetical protein
MRKASVRERTRHNRSEIISLERLILDACVDRRIEEATIVGIEAGYLCRRIGFAAITARHAAH